MNGCVEALQGEGGVVYVHITVCSWSISHMDSAERLLGLFDVRAICILKASDRQGEEEEVGHYSDWQRLCFRGSRWSRQIR